MLGAWRGCGYLGVGGRKRWKVYVGDTIGQILLETLESDICTIWSKRDVGCLYRYVELRKSRKRSNGGSWDVSQGRLDWKSRREISGGRWRNAVLVSKMCWRSGRENSVGR